LKKRRNRMKIKVLNYIVCGIITLTLASCGNKTQSDFVYSKADKKVEMILENNAEFLVVGKPTKANFVTENIDNQKFLIFGPGIMVNQADKDGFRFTITPIEKTLVDGKLKIQVTENIENGENFTHTFLVPVKLKAE